MLVEPDLDFAFFFSGNVALFTSFLCESTQTRGPTSLDKYINKY